MGKTPDNATDNKVGHKTPDEIKKGLECCYSSVEPMIRCEKCPYYGSVVCKMHLHTDALALIQQLEAEWDAAMTFLRGIGCDTCRYREVESWEEPCLFCMDYARWQWIGVQKEE